MRPHTHNNSTPPTTKPNPILVHTISIPLSEPEVSAAALAAADAPGPDSVRSEVEAMVEPAATAEAEATERDEA